MMRDQKINNQLKLQNNKSFLIHKLLNKTKGNSLVIIKKLRKKEFNVNYKQKIK
jgi:hypothetical protein